MKYNPHIVSRLHRMPDVSSLEELMLVKLQDAALLDRLQHLAKTFQERFGRAKQAAGDMPIAYRLDVITEDNVDDDLSQPKIGGVPNLNAAYFPDVDNSGDRPRLVRPKIDTFVRRIWPHCPACGVPMIFVGQFELSNWLFVIHALTYTASKSGRHWSSSGVSSYRLAMNHFGMLYHSWLIFFMCGDNHCYHVVSDATIWGESVEDRKATRKLRHIVKMENKCMCPYKPEVLRKSVEKFILPIHERIFTIPKLRVVDLKLRFDIDFGDKEFSGDSWDRTDQAEHRDPEIFRREGNFQLFGSPQSQQSPMRPVCMSRYPRPHHMAPLLNWDSSEMDMTHQIYGCMACHGADQGWKVWGIVDNSCT